MENGEKDGLLQQTKEIQTESLSELCVGCIGVKLPRNIVTGVSTTRRSTKVGMYSHVINYHTCSKQIQGYGVIDDYHTMKFHSDTILLEHCNNIKQFVHVYTMNK